MSVVAVIGGQWGDEGKGRIVDLLAQQANKVIRYSGGNNAGHTVINDRGAFKLHLVPAGIFDPRTTNIIGTGVVVDLTVAAGGDGNPRPGRASPSTIWSSATARTSLLPFHRDQDRLQESLRGDDRIGTTGRGYWPRLQRQNGAHRHPHGRTAARGNVAAALCTGDRS